MEDITVFFVDIIMFYILFHYSLKILFNPLLSLRSALTQLPCDSHPKEILSGSRLVLDLVQGSSNFFITFRYHWEANNPTVPMAVTPF